MHCLSCCHCLSRKQRGAIAVPHWFLSWIFPLALFFATLILYMRTMCPTIYPGDGAELTAAAWSLGVPHPTGYPLFMILGFLFQHLGLGSPAFSMNLLTALFGALACVGVYRLQREIWRILFGVYTAAMPAFRFATVALALALGASATWWDQSTGTEVYTLMLVFITFAWSMGLRLIRHPTRNGLWGLALLSGFAMLHHMLFIITFPLSTIAAINWWRRGNSDQLSVNSDQLAGNREEGRGNREQGRGISDQLSEKREEGRRISPRIRLLRQVGFALLLFALPLSGYLYLPVRAASLPAVNWGNPQGVQGILWHLTGKQYSSTKILAHPNGEKLTADEIPGHIRNRLHQIGHWMSTQYAPHDIRKPYRGSMLALVVILLAGLGAFMLWRHSPLAAFGFLGGLLINLFLVMIYTIADIQAYQMPLLILLGCLAMTGPVAVAEFFPLKTEEEFHSDYYWSRRAMIVGIFGLALAVFGTLNWHSPSRGINKSQSTEAYQYADTLMRILPPRSIVFTFSDFDIFPLWYIQTCENRRPDVAVMGANFVLNGWYAAQLRATLPPGISAYIGNEPPPKFKERWLTAFLGGMASPALQTGRPVYLTSYDADIARYYSVEQRFQVPSPTNSAVLESLADTAISVPSSSVPKGSLPPIPIYEILDPASYSPMMIQRFLQEFPSSERQLVRRSP